MSARTETILFARDVPETGGVQLVLHRAGTTTTVDLSPAMAARLVAELGAYLWKLEQGLETPF